MQQNQPNQFKNANFSSAPATDFFSSVPPMSLSQQFFAQQGYGGAAAQQANFGQGGAKPNSQFPPQQNVGQNQLSSNAQVSAGNFNQSTAATQNQQFSTQQYSSQQFSSGSQFNAQGSQQFSSAGQFGAQGGQQFSSAGQFGAQGGQQAVYSSGGTGSAARGYSQFAGQFGGGSGVKSMSTGRVQYVEEVPVYVEKHVEVPYQVLIERPVENRIENRYYVDREVEVPIKKIIEVPIEVIREEKKIVPVERRVEVERVVERPVEKIVEVPREVITEKPVPVDRVVNREVENLVVRPHRTESVTNDIVVEKRVPVDKVVERRVEYDVPVFVERENERTVEVPQTVFRDHVVEQPRIVEVKKEVPFTRIVEVPVERVVDKPVQVDRVVERPYEVSRVLERRVEVPVPRYVDKPVYVDKVVEIPVEKRVEVPFVIQKQQETIINRNVILPVVSTQQIDVPVETIVEEPVDVVNEVVVPYERPVNREVEYPVYRERENFEDIVIEVPVEKIVDVPVYVDKVVEVDVVRERFVNKPTDRVVEKIVEVERVIEKPVFNPVIKEVPRQKIVEKRVEVPIEKYVQIPKYVEVQKLVNVDRIVKKPRVVEKKSHRNLRKSMKTINVSNQQKASFTQLGDSLNRLRVENLKLEMEIRLVREQIAEYARVAKNPGQVAGENQEIADKIAGLERQFAALRAEGARIEGQRAAPVQPQPVELFTPADFSSIEGQIRDVEEKNRRLRTVLADTGLETVEVVPGPIVAVSDNLNQYARQSMTVAMPMAPREVSMTVPAPPHVLHELQLAAPPRPVLQEQLVAVERPVAAFPTVTNVPSYVRYSDAAAKYSIPSTTVGTPLDRGSYFAPPLQFGAQLPRTRSLVFESGPPLDGRTPLVEIRPPPAVPTYVDPGIAKSSALFQSDVPRRPVGPDLAFTRAFEETLRRK